MFSIRIRAPFSERWDRFLDNTCSTIAWNLPKRLIYWCAIRLMANATQGKYSNQIVPDLTAMDALKRWLD